MSVVAFLAGLRDSGVGGGFLVLLVGLALWVPGFAIYVLLARSMVGSFVIGAALLFATAIVVMASVSEERVAAGYIFIFVPLVAMFGALIASGIDRAISSRRC
ncbi:MAG: hypothetical protein ACRDJP_15560 [Actinomycetota bacterium]